MKKQSGFTLIELLLVLAIIGIISAIAIPALLSQRSRARDKATIENLTGAVGDLVGQYDKLKEQGIPNSTITTSLGTYLANNHAKDMNPWNPAVKAYPASVTGGNGTAVTQSQFITAIGSPSNNGSMTLRIQYPNGSIPGFLGGKVKLGNKVNQSLIFAKATAIE